MTNFFTQRFDIFAKTGIALDYATIVQPDAPATVTIAPTTTVSSAGGDGVQSVFDFSTLNNQGFIISGDESSEGVLMLGKNSLLSNAAGARIFGTGEGVHMDGDGATVDNSGSIESLGFDAVVFGTEASHATFTNNGSIFGRFDGVGMFSASDGGIIRNAGTIASADDGIVVETVAGGRTVIDNSGLIEGDSTAIVVNLGGIGWGRSVLLTLTGGLPLAHLSYAGFLLVPLAHGGVIQPSCAAIGGLVLASLVLKEKVPAQRVLGAASIIAGLCVIGAEALTTIGTHGLVGDLAFAVAGSLFATFSVLLRLWDIAPMRATAVVSVLALIEAPIHWFAFGFERMLALGLFENLLQAVVQGVFAGPAAIYLFTRSVVLLGAGRAAVFPSLVPGFTLLAGWLAIGEVPTAMQLLGFAIVLIGFRLTQRQ